jgi:DNA-binding GntR family transcriptional regulator
MEEIRAQRNFSVAQHVKESLQRAIVRGTFSPGHRIKEEDIASQLHVSRAPVREAFKELETEGLLRREPRKGVYVTEITARDAWEIYQLKIPLYSWATLHAMDKMDDMAYERLEEVVREMERSVGTTPVDLSRYQHFHRLFHRIPIDIADNRRLKEIMQRLDNQISRLSFVSLHDRDHLIRNCRYHRHILEAMKRKDTTGAEALISEHILEALDNLQGMMRKLYGPLDSASWEDANGK